MSTIASLLSLIDPSAIKPWSEGVQSATQAQTGLRNLADLKAKQQAEALVIEQIKNDPEVARRLFGDGAGPLLGSLQQPQAPPGAGPMTQQTVMPGQAPGAPQMVPGGQDLSRFAGVSPQGGGPLPAGVGMPTATPPQSTIASLGPAGQPQAHAPQNPLLEMARTDPRAAMMLQQQLEGRQDAAMKRQEQHLKLGASTLGYVGQQAQGVTDQASLDALRSELQSQGLGKYAAQLPQFYSKGAMEPFIARATDVEKSLTLQVQGIQAQAELKRAQMSGRVASTDQYLKALGVTPGTETEQDMQRALELQNKHLADIEAGKVNPQIMPGPGGGYWAVNPRTREALPVPAPGTSGAPATPGTPGGAGTPGAQGEQLRAPMTEGQAKTAGYTSRMQSGQEQLHTLEKSGDYATWKLPLTQIPGGRLLLSGKQKEYENAKGVFLAGLLRYDSAGQITEAEWDYYGNLYFPQYGDEPDQVAQKNKNREQAIKTHQEMLGRPLPGQEKGPQAAPPSQGSTGTGGQGGGNTFTDADIAATLANPANKGKTRQQVIDAALAKGLLYKER